MNNNRNVSTFSPFITFCQHVIPLAYDESMSYYETLCALRDYLLNTVIPAVNNNADAVTELQESYTNFISTINDKVKELEDYMNNYFENLDVQTEINNKLDQMAESGELTDIIAQYLELASILAFNTRTDLKNATNLNEGSFTYCFGKTTYNDGYGAFYKIRKSINTDVADDENLIALTNYPDLIAEKIPDNNFKELFENINTEIDSLETKVNQNYNTLNQKIENFEKTKYTIVIGDSYTADDSEGERVRNGAKSWCIKYQTLIKNTLINKAQNSAGFYYAPGDVKTFDEQYMEVINNDDIDNSLIDEIIIYGGLNDMDNADETNMINGAINLAKHIEQYTPKAKVYCAFFNAPKRSIKVAEIQKTNRFIQSLIDYNWIFNRAGGWLKGNNSECYVSGDGYHPNQTGCDRICACMYNFIHGGEGLSIDVTFLNPRITPSNTAVNGTIQSTVKYYPLTGTMRGEVIWTLTSNNLVNANQRKDFSLDCNCDASNYGYNPCPTGIAATNTRAVCYTLMNSAGGAVNPTLTVGFTDLSGANNTVSILTVNIDYSIV